LSQWATRALDGSADDSDLLTPDLNPEALTLLPGWYDEWIISERERLRQRLLHAMESVVRRLISRGLFADAVDVAMTAVGAEPLRESAQRVLIEAHLAEGNFVEARRAYMAYDKMLAAELGVSPGAELAEMVGCGAYISGSGNTPRISLKPRAPSVTPRRPESATGDSHRVDVEY
jgi:hypothetical protein